MWHEGGHVLGYLAKPQESLKHINASHAFTLPCPKPVLIYLMINQFADSQPHAKGTTSAAFDPSF
jgi:hypothetical protein